MSFFLMPKTTFTLLSSFSLLKLHIKKRKKTDAWKWEIHQFLWTGLDWILWTSQRGHILSDAHRLITSELRRKFTLFPDFKNAKSYHVEMMGVGGIKDSTLKWTGLLDWTTTMDHHRYSTPALPARVNISEYNYTDTCRYTALGNGKP